LKFCGFVLASLLCLACWFKKDPEKWKTLKQLEADIYGMYFAGRLIFCILGEYSTAIAYTYNAQVIWACIGG
jgi:hypothetical protein